MAAATQRGVDLAAALGRMGGNSRVYLRTLLSFVNDLTMLPGQLTAHLLDRRFVEACRLLHTFKGLAATLGILPLARLTADLEARIASAEPSTDHGSLVEQLSALVATTLQNIAFISEALQEAISRQVGQAETLASAAVSDMALPADVSDVRQSLHELAGLLRRADMRALAVFEHLQQSHAIQPEEVLQPLDEAMAALDFDQALSHCQTLQQRFEK